MTTPEPASIPDRVEAKLGSGGAPTVRLECPDPSWPELFERERVALAAAIGERAVGGIHHVGGTAVSGVDAEPVIDILVGTEDLAAARACREPLAALRYVDQPAPRGQVVWLCKPRPDSCTHHLRLVATGSPPYRRELAFRDLLRSDRQVAIGYAWMKRDLARRFRNDRCRYTAAKIELIRSALVAAELGG